MASEKETPRIIMYIMHRMRATRRRETERVTAVAASHLTWNVVT